MGLCKPGDNRVMGLQCRDEDSYERQDHHSLRGKEGEGVRHPSNSTRDRQTHRVLSMYSVHRINPQCVLTNITQLPPDRFVYIGEARSASFQPPSPFFLLPRPQALKLQHRQDAGVWFSPPPPGGTHSHA